MHIKQEMETQPVCLKGKVSWKNVPVVMSSSRQAADDGIRFWLRRTAKLQQSLLLSVSRESEAARKETFFTSEFSRHAG